MKNLRLIFAGIAVVATVTSMLAFTNNKGVNFCSRPLAQGAGACTGVVVGFKSTGNNNYFGYQKVTDCSAACNMQINIEGE